MLRMTLLLALALLASSSSLAHFPPGPVITCQTAGEGFHHDYLPSAGGAFSFADGNVEHCGHAPRASAQPLGAPRIYHGCTGNGKVGDDVLRPILCGLDEATHAVPLDHDGELDHGAGGALLLVETGDGVSGGAAYCYGGVGHHSGVVSAFDAIGYGPAFTVLSDHGIGGVGEECGDGVVQPCDPTPPAPSTLFFPANVVEDTAKGAAFTLFGPGGAGCNERDAALRFSSSSTGESGGVVPFGPGADGAYVVVLHEDLDWGRPLTGGHVWTT